MHTLDLEAGESKFFFLQNAGRVRPHVFWGYFRQTRQLSALRIKRIGQEKKAHMLIFQPMLGNNGQLRL
jgi:hypothetical protein